jgi:hypothetical protein
MIIVNFEIINFDCFSVSQEKKSHEVNRKPMIALDKENEIEKRRKELAKQKELRDKQTKEEVSLKIIYLKK